MTVQSRRKKRTFFCENCRNQVSERDRICPHCGRFFSAIRCPKCSFTGGLREFERGCPVCGYLGRLSAPEPVGQPEGFTLSDEKKTGRETVFPGWLYTALTLVLTGLLLLILFLYLRV